MEKKTTRKNRSGFSKYLVSILLLLLFEAVAITLWLTKNNLFYLLNFSYIGCCLSLGTAAGGWVLYAALPRRVFPGEYAD